MTKKLIYLTSFLLVLALAGTNTAFGALSLDIRITATNDDVEEEVSGGGMDRGSSDLELGHEGAASATSLQMIGLRFLDVDIPKGSSISKAYVQFAVDDKDNDYHGPPVSVLVMGEMNPNPVTFSSSSSQISSRPTTTASVVWNIPVWGRFQGSGVHERTPDLANVVQEIIDQDGWVAGNALAIILKDNPANPSQGCREAEAFDGDAAYAPLLHIEYTIPAATGPNPADGGVSGRAPLLQWTRGARAAFHDLYLGTSPDLGPADLIERLSYAIYWHIPGLIPGTTYYWRVDEIEPDGATIHTGDVWSFTAADVPAHSPNPSNSEKGVPPGVVLSWGPGISAVSHDVYFGHMRAEVVAGTGDTFKGNRAFESYIPSNLLDDTSYYWRIDEVEADGTKHTGDIWSFKTLEDSSLIGWWKFDEGQGIIAYDSSGYGNHGMIGHNNGNNGPIWTAGVMGGALELDGTDDYVSINSIASLMTTYNFTFSIWVQTDGEVLSDDHILLGSNTDSSHEFLFGIMNGNPWQEAGASGEYPPSVADSLWHMLTYVSESFESRIYVDGVLRKKDTADDDMAEETRWSIGQEWDSGPSDEYKGLIDDARFWIRPLTDEEIAQVFRGDVDRAHSPKPANGTTPDIEQVPPISWSPGEGATQHDVYFGIDNLPVTDADRTDTTGIYRGRQAATSYTPPEGLGWDTGPYFWRIDEVKADGTVSEGMVWGFSVGAFLNVDDFETYNDIDPPAAGSNTIFGTWKDGWQIPTNGALVGNGFPPYCETRGAYVHSGAQAMPFFYDNNGMYSEASRSLTGTKSNFTRQGVAELSLWFRGESSNAAERMYVALNGKAVYHDNPNAAQVGSYQEWVIPLQTFTNLGVNLNSVTSLAIGFGTPGSTAAGGTGTVYFDDIRLYQSRTAP